jgi:hypothetical protein
MSNVSGHFYRAEDGAAVYEITGANGKRRTPTLKDARFGLRGILRPFEIVPSVTTILHSVGVPHGLVRWKVSSALALAHANPPGDGEDAHAYANRVMSLAADAGSAVTDLGTRIHGAIEFKLVRGDWPHDVSDIMPILEPAGAWLDANVAEVLAAEGSFADPSGVYGGKYDLWAKLKDGRTALIDFKTTARTREPYDEEGEQLAAYGEGSGCEHNALLNVYIGTVTPGVRTFDWMADRRLARRILRQWRTKLKLFQLQHHWWPVAREVPA